MSIRWSRSGPSAAPGDLDAEDDQVGGELRVDAASGGDPVTERGRLVGDEQRGVLMELGAACRA
jgi:hypothetical protein